MKEKKSIKKRIEEITDKMLEYEAEIIVYSIAIMVLIIGVAALITLT